MAKDRQLYKLFIGRLIKKEKDTRQGAILTATAKQTLRPLATNDLDSDSASDDEIMGEELPNSGAGLQLLGAGDSSSESCSVASQDDEDSTIGDAVIAV